MERIGIQIPLVNVENSISRSSCIHDYNYIKKCILDSIVNDHATSIVNADEKFYI